MIKMNNIFQ